MLSEAQIKDRILIGLREIIEAESPEEKIRIARELSDFVEKEVSGKYALWNEKDNKELKKFKDNKISEVVQWILNLHIYGAEDSVILEGNAKFWMKKFE